MVDPKPLAKSVWMTLVVAMDCSCLTCLFLESQKPLNAALNICLHESVYMISYKSVAR